MKVEKSITIGGNKVTKEYSDDVITIYKDSKDTYGYTCYFVNNMTDEIFLKQTVEADMSQGTGFVSDVKFQEVK
jgi:hypothetical protein